MIKFNKDDIWWVVGFNVLLILSVMVCFFIFEFKNPGWLFLLIIPVLLSVYFIWKRDDYFGNLKISEFDGSKSILDYTPRLLKFSLLFSLALCIMSLARPQESMIPKDISKEGIDIILALDVSISMLSQDFKPNRLEVSKRVAMEFVKERINDRIGVVEYAGESFPRVPLTSDNSMVVNALMELNNGEVINGRLVNFHLNSNGTAIGQGLASAVNRLKDSESKSKTVILLSDGENTTGAISPEVATELAKAYGITVYTIGMGTEGIALSPRVRPGGFITFEEKPSGFNERALYEMAVQTGGKYFRANSENALQSIYKEIDQLEKTRFESTIIRERSDANWKFLLLAFTLISLVFVLNHSLFKSIYS